MNKIMLLMVLLASLLSGCVSGKKDPFDPREVVQYVDFLGEDGASPPPEDTTPAAVELAAPVCQSELSVVQGGVEEVELLGEASRLSRERLEISGPATIRLNGEAHGVNGAPDGKALR